MTTIKELITLIKRKVFNIILMYNVGERRVNGMLNANDVANFFIEVGSYNDNTEMTNARINKLLYFAQGWHLALKGTPLFNEDFEAWDYGPIINSIYQKYKSHKKGLITKPDDDFSIDDISEDDFEFLSDVFTFYVNDSTYALIKETHKKDSPWERVYACGMNNKINKEDIKNYFIKNNNFRSFKDVINTLPKEANINNEGYTVLPKEYEY